MNAENGGEMSRGGTGSRCTHKSGRKPPNNAFTACGKTVDTMEKRALAANATFLFPPLDLASKQRIYEKDRSEKKTISPSFDSNLPHPSHCTRIDSSFNFKVNLFNISLYLSRSLRIKRKFRRSGNFSSMIQDMDFSNPSRETIPLGKKANLIFARYLLRI